MFSVFTCCVSFRKAHPEGTPSFTVIVHLIHFNRDSTHYSTVKNKPELASKCICHLLPPARFKGNLND